MTAEGRWRDAPGWQARWELLEKKVGLGNFGHCFLARLADGSDPTPRIVKAPKAQDDAMARRAFHREALALEAMCHEGIPRIVEANTHRHADLGGAELYLAMEYFPGPTLEQMVPPDRPLPLPEALTLTERVLEAVAHCHGRGWIHGDVKPTNVLLHDGDFDDPVLIDFNRAVTWPDSGIVKGKDRGGSVLYGGLDDPRDDLMQVVRLLLFALTGDFQAPFRDWRMRPPHRCPPDGPALRDAVRGSGKLAPLLCLFDRGFALDPAGRYRSAEELAAALRELRAAPAVQAGPRAA